MSVVTAVRNVSLYFLRARGRLSREGGQFIRLLGGTFSLAVGATIMYVDEVL